MFRWVSGNQWVWVLWISNDTLVSMICEDRAGMRIIYSDDEENKIINYFPQL